MPPEETPTVLVVDDERRFVEAHARMLGDEYDVETAQGGTEALSVVDETVDVVVLDRKMPDRDGDEVAGRIRDRGLDCGIVMLTAVDPDFDIIEMGIDDYLTKPVTESELNGCIDDVLEWAEYDDALQDYFALSNKRDALVEEQSVPLASDRFSEIERRIERKAEEGLQKNREVLETLIQSSPTAIVTLDMEGKVDIWNPSAEEMFGWSAAELEGQSPPMFTSDALEELERIRASLFADSVVTDVQIECVTRSETPIDVSLSAAPLYEDGSMYGTMFVMLDVTERKQREQRLDVLHRVLRHNLRNDINTILGRAQALEERVEGETRRHMQEVIDTARELLAVSEKTHDIQSLLETGSRTVTPRDLERIVVRNVERAREQYDVEATIEVRPEETEALTNDGIHVAVWNLVENAIEHNDGSPTVAVTIDDERSGTDRWLTVTVADDGPGIEQSEIDVIRRGVEDTLHHGSGLGLWIVTWTVERCGGDLEFGESDLGGAAVTLRLRAPSP